MTAMHLLVLPFLSTLSFYWIIQHLLLFFTVGVPSLAWLYCLHEAQVLDTLPLLTEEKSNKSIVLVGNGPSLLNKPASGNVIDKAEHVVRFNTYKKEPLEFVGTKCTYHVLGTCKVLPEADSGKMYVLPLVNATLTHKVYVVFENLRGVVALKASLVNVNVYLFK